MRDLSTQDRYAVVHSMHLWLSQTMTWLHTQVRSLPERIESHVVCDQVANLDQFPIRNLVSSDRDAPIWRFASRNSWSVARRRQRHLLARQLKRSGARVLHSHFGDRAWANIRLAQALATRHVVTFYGYDVGRLPKSDPVWRDRYAALFESAQLFLCEGPFMARSLVALGCPAEKVKVHHLGINVDRIHFAPRVWRSGTPLRLLLAGSFTEKKGLSYGIEAIGRIARRVDVEVCLVGDADSKPAHQFEKSRILNAVRRAGLDSRVRMLGFQTYARLLETAAACHIFLSPSVTAADGDSEGGAPVAVIEMAASGMPVISTLHCDIPEVLENGVSGLLAPERDVDALADKLGWLVAHPEAWPDLTAAARRRIESEFDAVEQGHRLAAHYDRVASRP